jgi:hypothetical protein
MEIREIDIFDAPRPLVFSTLRDRYQDYLRYVPAVASVKLVESEEIDALRIRNVTEWEGKANIPANVRNHLRPDMIRWRIYSLWDEERWTNEWRLETFHFNDILECRGTLRFEEDCGRTRCTLSAVFRIDVPLLGPLAEKFIVRNFLNKSLVVNNKAVRRLLDEEKRAGKCK